MIDVTDETFEREVLRSEAPVVVDFWAPWCRPCKAIEPILEALEAEHGGVVFARLDIDENLVTPARYDVLSIPTTMLFDGGEPRSVVVGARQRAYYEQAWSSWLAGSAA